MARATARPAPPNAIKRVVLTAPPRRHQAGRQVTARLIGPPARRGLIYNQAGDAPLIYTGIALVPIYAETVPSTPVLVRFGDEALAELDAKCAALGLSRSAFVRQAVSRMPGDHREGNAAPERLVEDPQRGVAEPCRHPLTRRIGKGCGLCGQEQV